MFKYFSIKLCNEFSAVKLNGPKKFRRIFKHLFFLNLTFSGYALLLDFVADVEDGALSCLTQLDYSC